MRPLSRFVNYVALEGAPTFVATSASDPSLTLGGSGSGTSST